MTTTILVRTASSWRMRFMQLESNFFRIKAEDWQAATAKQIKDLDPGLDYNTQIHEVHTLYLNEGLNLSPPLTSSDFNGKVVLGVFREKEIRNRVPPSLNSQFQLVMPDGLAIENLGLDHLHGVLE